MIHIRSTISKLLYLASYDKSINGVLRSLKCHGEKKGGINLGMRIFLTRQKVLLEGYLLMSPSSPVPRRLIWPLLEASCCYVEWRPTFLFVSWLLTVPCLCCLPLFPGLVSASSIFLPIIVPSMKGFVLLNDWQYISYQTSWFQIL